MVFYNTVFIESMRGTFANMNNPTRDEQSHKNVMDKYIEDTNQGIPSQGDSCVFPFFGNVGSPLLDTLNIHRLNVVLLVWLWTTLNVLNILAASQIRTFFHGHRIDVDALFYSSTKCTCTPYSTSGGSITTNSQKYKRIRKRKS
jgi:hypothetical protein